MGVKTKLYQGNVGTEETFKALSENPPSILHIATHGFYFKEEDANLPYLANNKNFRTGTRQGVSSLDRSGLILSGAQRGWLGYQDQDEEKEEDGILPQRSQKSTYTGPTWSFSQRVKRDWVT